MAKRAIFLLLLVFLSGCSTSQVVLPPASATAALTCADLELAWGDWPRTISILEALIETGQSCGEEPLNRKLYAAHFNYALMLEQQRDPSDAVEHYTAAFTLTPWREEALRELDRLNALPESIPYDCTSDSPPNPAPPPADPLSPAAIVRIEGSRLLLNGEPYIVRGVNYYPRRAPWHRFLTEADLQEVGQELDLIQQAGFNTLRTFLWYEPLFTCAPEVAIPREDGFARLDAILDLADQRGLKVLVTLNDLPDLYVRPLYTDWARYDAQTRYIVWRYRSHPAVLGWDLRNEGDLDYLWQYDAPRFSQAEVIGWLAHVSEIVREADSDHLITAGWWGDPADTAPYVDVLSFHHWDDAATLAQRIERYLQADKPLLLEEVGYHTWADAPHDARDAAEQAALLGAVAQTADAHRLAGWMIWTAFDFEPDPWQPRSFEHYFGLWTVDLTPKPALDVIP